MKFWEILEDCPVIAAIKDEEGLKKSLELDSQIIFLLFGDICTVERYVGMAKGAGKSVIVQMDLIGGLSKKVIAGNFLKVQTEGCGGMLL